MKLSRYAFASNPTTKYPSGREQFRDMRREMDPAAIAAGNDDGRSGASSAIDMDSLAVRPRITMVSSIGVSGPLIQPGPVIASASRKALHNHFIRRVVARELPYR